MPPMIRFLKMASIFRLVFLASGNKFTPMVNTATIAQGVIPILGLSNRTSQYCQHITGNMRLGQLQQHYCLQCKAVQCPQLEFSSYSTSNTNCKVGVTTSSKHTGFNSRMPGFSYPAETGWAEPPPSLFAGVFANRNEDPKTRSIYLGI